MKSFAKKSTFLLLTSVLMVVSSGGQAQTGLRAEVHKPLLAAQEALKSNQTEQAARLAAEKAKLEG